MLSPPGSAPKIFATDADVNSARAPGVRAISAGTNRAYTNNQTAPAGVLHGAAGIFAGCIMTPRASGVFRVGFSVAWGQSGTLPANGDTLTFQVITTVSTLGSGVSYTGGTPTGANGTTANGWQVNAVAGSAMVRAVVGGPTNAIQETTILPALTGALSGKFVFTGVLRNIITGSAETPFTSPVLISVSLNESVTDNITLTPINAWCEEEV
jgi:hypothetical protein